MGAEVVFYGFMLQVEGDISGGQIFHVLLHKVIYSWLLPVRRACTKEALELFSVPVGEKASVTYIIK